ncbi:MAG: ComF family protein [Acidimicrobiales bacterium]
MPAVNLEALDPKPRSFGECRSCAYREGGSAAICFTCASRQVELVGGGHCRICDQRLPASGCCSNYWCHRPSSDRYFEFVYAIAMRSGALQAAINRYKYQGQKGWASIFARVLVGYLDESPGIVQGWDAIIASPTYTGRGSRRSWDHIALILQRAAVEAGGRWPIREGSRLVIKTCDTPPLVKLPLTQRRQIAETDLRASLSVPEPSQVTNRSFLVFDDVFTDGCTLREVARALTLAGASQVAGIVLARQPWQQQ